MRERRKESLIHTVRPVQISLVTCMLLCCTKVVFCLPAERLHCLVILPVGYIHMDSFEVKNSITLKIVVSIASFKVIGKLQRGRLRQSCAAVFRKVGLPCGGECNGADLMEISEIPKNPGGTEHAQAVCTRLFLLCPCTRAWERG